MRNGSRASIFAILALLVGTYPCAALSDDIDIRGINFKLGRPLAGDSLGKTVAEPAHDSLAILGQDADVLKAFPKLRVKIVGFTDNQECQGTDCIALSLRRAEYVRDWFLAHGIPSLQIAGAEGHGKAEPIDDNAEDMGRARNRRAEVQVLTMFNGDAPPFP